MRFITIQYKTHKQTNKQTKREKPQKVQKLQKVQKVQKVKKAPQSTSSRLKDPKGKIHIKINLNKINIDLKYLTRE